MNGNPPDLISWLVLQNGDQNDPDAYYYGRESPTDGVRLTGPEMKGVVTVIDTILWDELKEKALDIPIIRIPELPEMGSMEEALEKIEAVLKQETNDTLALYLVPRGNEVNILKSYSREE